MKKASKSLRIKALVVFMAICAFFVFFNLAAKDVLDSGKVFDPCGFQLNYNLPCPTCGMTRSFKAFSIGHILRSFHIQPAGAVICLLLASGAIFALLISVLGLDFYILKHVQSKKNIGYIILALLLIIAGGWAVTAARALAQNI